MRTLMLAFVMFAAGYGTVMFGQQAGVQATGYHVLEAISRQVGMIGRQAKELLNQPAEPRHEDESPPVLEREATFSDYLKAANRAFDIMERDCLEGDRRRLGRAFYDLVAYTRGLPHKGTAPGVAPADVPANLTELEIYVQVIDAMRRGILRSRHFAATGVEAANGAQSHMQPSGHRMSPAGSPGTAAQITRTIALDGKVRLTRCPPAAP